MNRIAGVEGQTPRGRGQTVPGRWQRCPVSGSVVTGVVSQAPAEAAVRGQPVLGLLTNATPRCLLSHRP